MSFRGLFTGVTGLQAQSSKMEVIGNNLANLNTAGFKKGQVNFSESFHDVLKGASSGEGQVSGTNPMTIGSGVNISAINNIFTQGNRLATGRTLDFMVEGDDFMIAQNGGTGELMLTRSGSFQFDADMFLVDNFGNRIQGFNVDRETGIAGSSASAIQIDTAAIEPNATTQLNLEANIDSSTVEQSATASTAAWELFSGGENFGSMGVAVDGASGSRSVFGSGYYAENALYYDSGASINAGLNVVTLAAAPAGAIEGYNVGDIVSIRQGAVQVQRTISAVNTGTREITLSAAAPGTFAAGATEVTNLSSGTAARGTSGATDMHNDVLDSQISMVDQDGRLIASFYRVSGPAKDYTHATANIAGGGTMTVGTGEFTDMQELKEMMELALRDSQLTHYSVSNDLKVGLDKFGKVSFEGTGLVEEFRLVMNADNTEMLDRFNGIALTDNAAVATTQARVDVNGEVIAPPSLGLGARATNASKAWYLTAGLENYGYNATNQATEYGEFAGLRMDGGATGTGFGSLQLSIVNALGNTVTQEFKMVARDADASANEFTTMGELANLLQNTLRSSTFSSVAVDGTLEADQSASVSFVGGRLSVSTNNGVFNNLTLAPVNTTGDPANDITRSDQTNFGTVLGDLATGISGKSGTSNHFIQADVVSQAQVYDSQGNEHTVSTYFVRDRSNGLTNIEWKYKAGLNPNLNTFASESDDQDIYGNTFNSIQDTAGVAGVLAFDITTGNVLNGTGAGSDPRYSQEGNISFTPATNSQEADVAEITIDFTNLTSYNGANSIIGFNVDGYGMGSLVNIVTEENTGNINGVYSNGKIRNLAKIGLMNIANPEGLQKIGNSYYTQTPNSTRGGTAKGLDQIFAIGAQAPASTDSVTSKVHGGALEASNVDLTEELTEMIVTQRSYSASGKTITTTDEMLQEALNLKR